MKFDYEVYRKAKLFQPREKAIIYLDSIENTARSNGMSKLVISLHLNNFCKIGIAYGKVEDQMGALKVFDEEYANGFEKGILKHHFSIRLPFEEDPTRKLYLRFKYQSLLPNMDQLRRLSREEFSNKVLRSVTYTNGQNRGKYFR